MEEFNMQDNMDKATGALLDASQRELKFTQKVNVNGFNKTGTFVAGIPTIAQRIQIGVIRARMLGGVASQSIDNFTDDLAFMTAYLQVVIKKHPSWWVIEEMDDVVALREMFTQVTNWVNSFQRKDTKHTDATDSSTTTDEEDMEGNEDV